MSKAAKIVQPQPQLQETDLRSISRDADRMVTTVTVEMDWQTKIKWLIFGQAQVRRQSDSRHDGRWRLEGRMTAGVTDFEHDSAYAVRLPLIGLQLGDLAIHYHTTYLVAWVDPNDPEGFRVPRPGYNPMEHKDAHRCKSRTCLREDPKGHIIVPEGFYVPPFDADLYELVRGKRVDVSIGPVYPEE